MNEIFEKLNELYKAGHNDYQLSAMLNIPQPTIWKMRNGRFKTTSYERGKAILQAAKKLL
jgi:hypothetical protein